MNPVISALTERRATLHGDLAALLAKIEKERREFTPAEDLEWADGMAALAECDAQLAEETAKQARAVAADAAAEKYARPSRPRRSMSIGKMSDEEAAVRDWLSGRGDRVLEFSMSGVESVVDVETGKWSVAETRDLTTAVTSIIPAHTRALLLEHLIANSAIRQTNVTVLRTPDGNDLKLPKTTSAGTAILVGEGTALSEADPALGSTTVGAFKFGQFVQISSELIQDSAVPILPFLARDAGRALGNGSGAYYMTGSGTSQPLGVMVAAGTGCVGGTGQSGIPTSDELIDLFFSVAEPYRRNGFWMMNDSTLQAIRKLQDGNLAYRMGPLSEGGASTLVGRPVVTDPNIAATGTSANSVIWGSFEGYAIRDVDTIRWERSDDFAFSTDLVSFRSILRTDADLVDLTGCVKVYSGGTA